MKTLRTKEESRGDYAVSAKVEKMKKTQGGDLLYFFIFYFFTPCSFAFALICHLFPVCFFPSPLFLTKQNNRTLKPSSLDTVLTLIRLS